MIDIREMAQVAHPVIGFFAEPTSQVAFFLHIKGEENGRLWLP
jgi:hypothetical protein